MKKSIKELKSIHILSLLGLVFIISACGGSGGGSSSSSTPTPAPTKPSELKCPANLGSDYKAIDNYYDLKFYLLDDSTSNSYYDKNRSGKYCLTSDITIGSDFTTIDTFSGEFNGQGKAINSLKRTFIREQSGMLNRVTFNQPVISSVLSSGQNSYAAIITNNNNRGTIEKIKVINPEISGGNAGGLIGENNGTVKNSQVDGGTITAATTNEAYLGGLVSLNYGTIGSMNKVSGMTIKGNYYTGGLVGTHFYGTITTNQVTSTNLTGKNVGGILGQSVEGILNYNCVSGVSLIASQQAGYILGSIYTESKTNNPTFSNNQFKPTSISGGVPNHWGVGDATAATSGIDIITTDCPELSFNFN